MSLYFNHWRDDSNPEPKKKNPKSKNMKKKVKIYLYPDYTALIEYCGDHLQDTCTSSTGYIPTDKALKMFQEIRRMQPDLNQKVYRM